MTSNDRKQSLEDVLDAFFFTADAPSAGAVLRACEAHPEFRADILEFAALWATHDASPEPAAEVLRVPAASLSRMQSYVLNNLHADAAQPEGSGVEAARAALRALAGAALRRAATAAGLGTATLLLHKVLTNAIVDTPRAVLSALARHLQVAVTDLQLALAGHVVGGRHYSASQKPNAPTQETWAHAVGDLPGVSHEERARLLALTSEEAGS
ncbi:hypothetical protein FN976_11430 [Caenimonas sedimenti]|uniref:Uncharacterized protein n=1 Tax=Caenimonas sedimenti TaxID=2596921 RepID=A0A562ZT55_9BURK|nr:hypothetical protein [Caenimonas sedimenti]TWO71518.1 hypothetical protein FN976_11430 [Caenimonas sedimenti]